jgi:capsular exopolysaccharide synthesis family protein
MSKIYEALLRAEQERIAAAASKPAGSDAPVDPAPWQDSPSANPHPDPSADPHAAGVVPEAAADVPAPALPTEPPVYPPPAVSPAPVTTAPPLAATLAQPAFAEPEYVVPVGAPRLDVAAIRSVVWHPKIDKLPALEERGSAVEQFRSLRTRIFGFRELNTLKSIIVSSGLPREGKSFIAANLAVSFARHKASRVLLIDGDMRRSSLHILLGCEKGPGLTTYLAGRASMTDIMQRPQLTSDGSPLQSGLATLTFIGGGDEGDLAADLAGSSRFKQLIETAGTYFDWIVVDSSPVNLVTDGVNLASACDAVLMVARGGVTKFEAAQRALAELKASKILGVVLNAVEEQPVQPGYYGYYGYDTYDSYDAPKAAAEPAAT